MFATDSSVSLDLSEFGPEFSPGSNYGNSQDMEFQSEEDFLQHLSSSLDIPLLLNSGRDEMNILNSCLDASANEILSEISMCCNKSDSDSSIRSEPDIEYENSVDRRSQEKSKSNIRQKCEYICIPHTDDEEKHPLNGCFHLEQYNEKNCNERNSICTNKYVANKNTKKIKIELPKDVATVPTLMFSSADESPKPKIIKKIEESPKPMIIKKAEASMGYSSTNAATEVVLAPMVFGNGTMFLNSHWNVEPSCDPKILKKHIRKIKNRESASLSRKKKKDYLTLLENTVKHLTSENEKLKNENDRLKNKVAQYESSKSDKGLPYLKFEGKLVLCMFFIVFGMNFNLFRFGISDRSLSQTDMSTFQSFQRRNLLSIVENQTEGYDNLTNNILSKSMCPVSINQSESERLVLDLERWIGKPANLTSNIKNTPYPVLSTKSFRKKYLKKRKIDMENSYMSSFYSAERKPRRNIPKLVRQNELQVFSPKVDQLYSDFFHAINRQEDTYYVVSFSDHHMLLPALHHNGSRRPKMSLIMPNVLQNLTHMSMVQLMQIDCEVQNTRLINVKNGAIPRHFRKTDNATTDHFSDNRSSNNRMKSEKKRSYNIFRHNNSNGTGKYDEYTFH